MRISIHKYTILACCMVAFTFLTTTRADAAYEVQVEFFFDTQSVPGKEVSRYRLYKGGINLCEEAAGDPQVISCMVDTPGTYEFTLSVLYSDETESPQSAPFEFSVTDEHVALKGLQVLTGQHPPEIDGYGSLAGGPAIELADVIHSLRQATQ